MWKVLLWSSVVLTIPFGSQTEGGKLRPAATPVASDTFTQAALDTLVGDLQQEIAQGSTATTVGNTTIYQPLAPANMLPGRSGNPAPTGSPVVDPIPNLIRRSVRSDAIAAPGVSSIASAVNSAADTSLNGSAVNSGRWNLHYLIPRFDAGGTTDSTPDAAAHFTTPDWVLVSRNGAAVRTNIGTGATALNNPDPANGDYVVGRYAFAMYDEGGLLDINAAGYPTPATPAALTGFTTTQVGWKGLLPLADLTQLPIVKQPASAADYLPQASVDNLVGWRNYASAQPSGIFPNFTFDAAASARYYSAVLANRTGFLSADPAVQFNGQSDQRFTSRQQLIGLSDALGISRNALQYLTTFSRALEQPSFVPPHIQYPSTAPAINSVASSTPPAASAADSYLGNNDAAGSANGVAVQDLINPAFLNVRVQTAFTRSDGSTAAVGDLLVKRKFALSRLGEISYSATDSTPSLTDPAAGQNHIKEWFGLSRTSASAPWTYNHGATHIRTLSEIAAAGREPDFAELLKAAINAGSLAKGGPNLHPSGSFNYQYTVDVALDYNVLQTMANVIDQYDADSYPTVIQVALGNYYQVFRGVEDLPYFYRFHPFTVVTRLPSPLLSNASTVAFKQGTTTVTTVRNSAPASGAALTDAGQGVLLYAPDVWNPHDPNSTQGTTGNRPSRFRFSVVNGDPAGQTNYWASGAHPHVLGEYATAIPPAASFPAVTYTTLRDTTSAFTFSDNNGAIFREPTLLWRADAPTGANIMPETSSLAGPYTDANTNVSYYGAFVGAAPMAFVANVNSSTYAATPSDPSNNYLFETAGLMDAVSVIPAGAYRQCTFRLSYQDPTSGNWIVYDEKYPDMHGLYSPQIVLNKADYSNQQWQNPYLSGQMRDCASGDDPRIARFGINTASSLDAAGAPVLEAAAIAAYNAGNTVSGNMRMAASRYTVLTTVRPAADRGNQANYSVPCNTSDPGKNQQMRWFSGGGYNASANTTAAPTWPLFFSGLLGQNNPAVNIFARNNSTIAQLYYEDADGVARRATGAYALSGMLPTSRTTAASQNLEGLPEAIASTFPAANGYGVGTATVQSQSRPLILNRPFHSVAEMGYASRGGPWKNLDFFTPESGDGALLDTFCLTEPPVDALVGGKVNLNTRQAPVLQAVLAGAYRDETNNSPAAPNYALPALTAAESANVSSRLLAITTDTAAAWRGPLANPAHLVGRFILSPGDTAGATDLYQFTEPVTNTAYTFAGLSAALDGNVYTAAPTVSAKIQRMRESAIRPLADCGQTRVWNILIDLVAQTGNYPAAATGLGQFQVAQETHYWLHVALDRFTGQVLDENIEQVFEGLTDLTLSTATIPEGQTVGTVVGTIQPVGAANGDTFTYSLVSGPGSDNNAAFTVSGNTLQTAAVFRYLARSSYGVRLRAVNGYGQIFEKALTVMVSPSPYTQWKLANFRDSVRDASVAGDLSDPDHDGISNVVEYALGLSPIQPNASGVSARVVNGVLTMNYTRSSTASGVAIHAMWSRDLTDPNSWTRTGVTETMLSDNGIIQQWQATVPVSGSQPGFLRLRAAYQ